VINVGAWLLLSAFFAVLLLLVQRAERNRRLVTLLFMFFTASLISAYGWYRITTACAVPFGVPARVAEGCALPQLAARNEVVAANTRNAALLTAIAANVVFWVLVGRYNPPGSSDEIKVLGMND
jgi:hypothetical protein